jgi:type II secretory pathway pseudopilin PulG
MHSSLPIACRRRAFTLIELLVAAFSMAVLIAALVIPVRGALREREHANEMAAESFRLRRTMDRVTRDLDGILWPGTMLTGQFIGTKEDTQAGRQDSLSFATSLGSYLGGTSGVGGCVRVEYTVEESGSGEGYDWVRTETLNLLSDDEDATVESVLLSGVQSVELSYYDATAESWLDSWDTEGAESGLPAAIQVIFCLPPENEGDEPVPHRLLIPILVKETESGSNNAAGGEGGQE